MQRRTSQNIKGMDVSHWQGLIDWQKVKEDGIRFVYVKATEGITIKDPLFEQNVRGAKQAGLLVGAYHFARFYTNQTAAAECKHFLTESSFHTLDLPLVLDLETDQGLAPDELTDCALEFCKEVQKESPNKPLIYTSTEFAKHHLTRELNKFPLWIAHFGVNEPGENGIWTSWHVFQYTNTGTVAGVRGNVDLDEWDYEAFEHITGKNHNLEGATKGIRIKKGDTFWALELAHGWKHGTLAQLNPNCDPKKLIVGSTINCPEL